MNKANDSKFDIKILDNINSSRIFFDMRITRAVPVFIFLTIILFSGFIIWASCAKMDDVVKAKAVLRPVENISSIRSMTSGEVYEKNYTQNDLVSEGQVLIKFDTGSDTIDLQNSNRYLSQLIIDKASSLSLEQTILKNENISTDENNDAWILCSTYIAEYSRLLEQRDQIKQKINRENKLPDSMKTLSKISDLESDLLLSEKNGASGFMVGNHRIC